MKFMKLVFDSSDFDDESKLLKKMFPIFWHKFSVYEENKNFFVLVFSFNYEIIIDLFLVLDLCRRKSFSECFVEKILF